MRVLQINRVYNSKSPAYVRDSVENAISGQGTSKDTGSYFRFRGYEPLTRDQLEAMYSSSHISRKAIDMLVDDQVKNGWRLVVRDKKMSESDRIDYCAKIEEYATLINVKEKVTRAMKIASVYGGCGIVMGIDDGANLGNNIPIFNVNSLKRGCLRYVQQIDRWYINAAGLWDGELASENYGYPKEYVVAPFFGSVTPYGDESNTNSNNYARKQSVTTQFGTFYHWTRVVRFDGELLPLQNRIANQGWNQSILEKMYQPLLTHQATMEAVKTLIQKQREEIYKISELRDSTTADGLYPVVVARVKMATSASGIFNAAVIDKDDDIVQKVYNFSGLDTVLNNFRAELSAASNIPQSLLWGDSPGGMNATGKGEAEAYFDRVRAKQQNDLRPKLLKLYRIIAAHVHGFVPAGLDIEFYPVQITSPLTEATRLHQETAAQAILLNAGVLTRAHVAKHLKVTSIGNSYGISNEYIQELDKADEIVPQEALPPLIDLEQQKIDKETARQKSMQQQKAPTKVPKGEMKV